MVVPTQWKTSVSIAGIVCGVAWYNYTFMKETWLLTQSSPTTYRYTDWLITVPLQIAEFYFLLKAAGPVPSSLGVKLFSTSVLMVFAGWLAETCVAPKLLGFVVGMACWLYIVSEVTFGSAAAIAKNLPEDAAAGFANLRNIVTFGWTIYPIGFALAYLCFLDQPAGDLSQALLGALNVTYNIADGVNKGAFGLCMWSAAMSGRGNNLAQPLLK